MKAVWQLIQRYSGASTGDNDFFELLDSSQLNLFNNHFIKTPMDINLFFERVEHSSSSYTWCDQSIYLSPTDVCETSDTIQSMSGSSSSDYYGLSNNFIKKISPLIAPKLVQIVSIILSKGCFPNTTKKKSSRFITGVPRYLNFCETLYIAKHSKLLQFI